MKTLYFGAPYGHNGEHGEDVRTIGHATAVARKTLQPGQTMYVYLHDPDSPCAQYTCDAQGKKRRTA